MIETEGERRFSKLNHWVRWMVLLLMLQGLPLSAQKFLGHKEVGFWLGGTHYVGDLNPRFQLINFIRPGGGLIYQKNLHERWSWRNSLSVGQLYGHDRFSNLEVNRQRNLHFKSLLIEGSSQIVFNFLPFEIGVTQEGWLFPFTPYMFWGLGMFYFDPRAEYEGTWYRLRQLDTEGQGTAAYNVKPYSRIQLSMPFGFGLKFGITRRMAIGLEWGMRRTFTDYLDDVSTVYPSYSVLKFERGEVAAELSDPSLNKPEGDREFNTGRQRGNSATRDWYSFFGVQFMFKIPHPKAVCPSDAYR
jgi:hypothetical protein